MILLEGGNIFKDADGNPATTRISRGDVQPTVQWIEKITGLDHSTDLLGSTGKVDTSGDIDIAINAETVKKDELFNKLVNWTRTNHPDDDIRSWVAKSGISVHFKTPIAGDPNKGFVQTDLMFGDNEFMRFSMSAPAQSEYKGAHRQIMMASIAKGLGMKWSTVNGLMDRETNQLISKDPQVVAVKLLGDGAKVSDLDSVETIHAKIKGKTNYDELMADAKENFEKNNVKLPESIISRFGTNEWFREMMDVLGK